jgi:hypothetical protein
VVDARVPRGQRPLGRQQLHVGRRRASTLGGRTTGRWARLLGAVPPRRSMDVPWAAAPGSWSGRVGPWRDARGLRGVRARSRHRIHASAAASHDARPRAGSGPTLVGTAPARLFVGVRPPVRRGEPAPVRPGRVTDTVRAGPARPAQRGSSRPLSSMGRPNVGRVGGAGGGAGVSQRGSGGRGRGAGALLNVGRDRVDVGRLNVGRVGSGRRGGLGRSGRVTRRVTRHAALRPTQAQSAPPHACGAASPPASRGPRPRSAR